MIISRGGPKIIERGQCSIDGVDICNINKSFAPLPMKEDRSETEKKNGFVFRDSSEGGICSNWSYTSVRV